MRSKLFFIQLLFILCSTLSADIISYYPVVHDEGILYISIFIISLVAAGVNLFVILFLNFYGILKKRTYRTQIQRLVGMLIISLIIAFIGMALFIARGFHVETHHPIRRWELWNEIDIQIDSN